MKYYKNKGTTLVEVIIAVAILAMVGVAVLDAFNISSKVNRKAKVVDSATSAASNCIEEFKIDPDKFIASRVEDDTISSSKNYDYTLSKDILNYSGKHYYDYKWNPVSSPVSNGFTLDYSINENAIVGESTMFKPVGTIEDEKFCLEKDITQYLLYVKDVPKYLNWPDDGDLIVVLFKGWTYDDFRKWLYLEDETKNTYYKDVLDSIKLYPEYTGPCTTDRDYAISTYNIYKGWGDYYFSYYGLSALKDNNTIVKNTGKFLFKSEADGALPIKINKKDLDLTSDQKCNIQIVNESKFDVQLYLTGENQADVDAINEKVDVDLEKGVATKTIVNERKLATSSYDMNVSIKNNIDGKQVYELSSKEYLVK